MRAIVREAYGPLESLELRQLERPTIGDHEVLVRVHAAALHIGDCYAVRGSPFVMRLATGLFRPNSPVPGFDLAGHVEAVGKNVQRFHPGNEVFGADKGTCAEYTSSHESR